MLGIQKEFCSIPILQKVQIQISVNQFNPYYPRAINLGTKDKV